LTSGSVVLAFFLLVKPPPYEKIQAKSVKVRIIPGFAKGLSNAPRIISQKS
jgi:hypothetical protein